MLGDLMSLCTMVNGALMADPERSDSMIVISPGWGSRCGKFVRMSSHWAVVPDGPH